MNRAILLLLLSTVYSLAGAPWPQVSYTEVRAYAWPDDDTTFAVILPRMKLKPGAINKDGTQLTPDQTKRLLAAMNRRPERGSIGSCHLPHNAFVFYNAAKKPVAFVEICFKCNHWLMSPRDFSVLPDLIGLGTIFDELKLPMGAYPNLKAFRKSLRDK